MNSYGLAGASTSKVLISEVSSFHENLKYFSEPIFIFLNRTSYLIVITFKKSNFRTSHITACTRDLQLYIAFITMKVELLLQSFWNYLNSLVLIDKDLHIHILMSNYCIIHAHCSQYRQSIRTLNYLKGEVELFN